MKLGQAQITGLCVSAVKSATLIRAHAGCGDPRAGMFSEEP